MNGKFFLQDHVDVDKVAKSVSVVYNPFAKLISRLLNAETPVDALKTIEDIFKIGLQLNTLMALLVAYESKIELPRALSETIKNKWLSGKHDLTEGERVALLKVFSSSPSAKHVTSRIGSTILSFMTPPYDDVDSLLSFKKDASHAPSGDIEWCLNKLREIWPQITSFIQRLERLSEVQFVTVNGVEATSLLGLAPRRLSAGTLTNGTYLIKDDEGLQLGPLILPCFASREPTIRLFSGMFDRRAGIAMFRSLGDAPEESYDDGEAQIFLRKLNATGGENDKLFGLEKAMKQSSEHLKNWASNLEAGAPPLIVIGEEGTGKTSLITRTIQSLPNINLLLVKVFGYECYGGRPSTLFLSVLAQLFGIDRGYDLKVIEKLRSESIRLGGIGAANRIANWLSSLSEAEFSVVHPQHEDISRRSKRWGADSRHEQLLNQPTQSSIATLYADLATFIRLYAEDQSTAVLLWLQDAQLLEAQPEINIEVVFDVLGTTKVPRVLLVGEFRAERTRDIDRLKSAYGFCRPRLIETKDLSEHEIHGLIAERLNLPASELSTVISSEIYKKAGGNPKAILDLLQLLETSGRERDCSDDTTYILLKLPEVVAQLKVTEVKEVNKARISLLNLSPDEYDALTIACLCPTQECPAHLFQLVLGENCRGAVSRLEESGLVITSEDLEEWKFRFEHLAARDAAADVCLSRDEDELRSLNIKVVEAWHKAIADENSRFGTELREICTRLSEAAKDAEGLAPTIVMPTISAKSESLSKLKKWAFILKRNYTTPSPMLSMVHKFLLLRIKELEEPIGFSEADYLKVATLYKCFKFDGMPDLVRRAVVPLCADSFGRAFLAREEDFSLIASEFAQFLSAIGNAHPENKYWVSEVANVAVFRAYKHLGNQDDVSAVLLRAMAGSFSVLKAHPAIALIYLAWSWYVMKDSQARILNAAIETDDVVQLIEVIQRECAQSGSLLSEKGKSFYERIANDVSSVLIQRAISSDKKEVVRASELLAKLHVDGPNAFPLDLKEIYLVHLQRELETCQEGNEVISALAKYRSYLPPANEDAEMAYFSVAINSCYYHGFPHDIFHGEFFRLVENATFNSSVIDSHDITYIARAISILANDAATRTFDECLKKWILNSVKNDRTLPKVLLALQKVASVLDWKTSALYEFLKTAKLWKKDENLLIDLYSDWALRADSRYEELPFSKDRFDKARREFIKVHQSPDSPLRRYILNISYLLMKEEILCLSNVHNGDDKRRLSEFREILEYRAARNGKLIPANIDYWKTRWKLMEIAGETAKALSECRGMLRAEVSSMARAALVPELVQMLLPGLKEMRIGEDGGEVNAHIRANFEEIQTNLNAWREIDPYSAECGEAMVRLARHLSSTDARSMLIDSEKIAEKLVSMEKLGEAVELYDLLVDGYYRLGLASEAGRVANLVLELNNRIVPRPSPNDFFDARNNFAYTYLSESIRHGHSVSPVIETFSALENDAQGSRLLPLITYNLSVAWYLADNAKQALQRIEWVLSEGRKLTKDSDELGWLLVVVPPGGSSNVTEIRSTRLTLAAILSGAAIFARQGENDRARMWLAAFFASLKSTPVLKDRKVWEVSFNLAQVLKSQVPHWAIARAMKIAPELEVVLKNNSEFEVITLEKHQRCLCGSQKAYKDCCMALLRC